MLGALHEQMMIMFQFENFIRKKTDDLDMINEKEEQLRVLAGAHTWALRDSIAQREQKRVEAVACASLFPDVAEKFLQHLNANAQGSDYTHQ